LPVSRWLPFQSTGTRVAPRSFPVPLQSPSQARAIFMPGTARAVNRFPSDSSQDSIKAPVLMPPGLTTRHRWFTFVSPSWLIPADSHGGFSTDVHHHGSFTTAARGGLTPAPACRCRRTYLHLCNSMVAVIVLPSTSENSSSLQDTPTHSPNPSTLP